MNKKGFTLVELIVSFVLIATISIFLFQIVSIISTIYSEQGIKTELVLEQSNISNFINKDIYQNEQSNNYVKRVVMVNDNQVDIKFKNGNTKSLFINRKNNSIKYGNYTQKFLNGTVIGNIDVDLNYISESDLKYNGVSTIKIPITYGNINANFDILAVIRFSSSEYAFSVEDDVEYITYSKYNDGDPIYFNVTTGTKCTQQEQETNYTNNDVYNALNTGCMRFFAFLDNEYMPSVNMILDHNVVLSLNRPDSLTAFKTATSSWQGVLSPDNHSQFFTDAESRTTTLNSNWASEGYKARFITGEEVAQIIGRPFDHAAAVTNDWVYLDGALGSDPLWQTQVASSSNESSYWWLYSYLTGCPNYGCRYNNPDTYTTWAYWTDDKTVGTYYYYWTVNNQGKLVADGDGNLRGARPVIKVLKSLLIDS